MKFPLADRPFTRLYLTPDRHDELMSLVHANLMAALMEYEHLSLLQHAHGGISLGKPRFKTVKSRENLTVVKDKNDLSLDWSLPRLLMVGTVVGTLDDIMYGTLAPTAEAMRIRSAYVHDDMVDADVLCTLTSPSVDHPFEFLGIKWAVRYHATALNPMVSPRDSVVVEATGIHTTQSGERLGYRVVHSVNLPECPELKGTHGIIRTRLSSTALFKQLPNGVVDVYMTRHVEAAGTNSLTESSTLTAAATSMLSVWKSVWCSQNKKLACASKDGARKWAMQGGGDKIERLVVTTDDHGNYCCGLCLKHYRLYNSVITCQACNLMVCSKCQVGRKLGKINYLGEVTQYPVLFCKNCITRSLKESAFDVAKSECAHVDDKATTTTSSPPETSVEVDPQLQTTTRSGATMPKMSIATNSTFAGSLDGLAMASYDDIELQIDLDVQTVDDWEREHDASLYMEQPPTLSASDTSELAQSQTSARGYATTNTPDDHQQQLWRQMTQLCMAAEETYLLTKKNADAMRHQRQAFA